MNCSKTRLEPRNRVGEITDQTFLGLEGPVCRLDFILKATKMPLRFTQGGAVSLPGYGL